MKYLITATFAVVLMAFGFGSLVTIPAQANDEFLCTMGDDSKCPGGGALDSICDIDDDYEDSHGSCSQSEREQESTEQFADKENDADGSGESGGDDFGGGDRAAASTEGGQDQ